MLNDDDIRRRNSKGTEAEMKRTTLRPARVNPLLRHSRERRLSLDGEWLFRLDENDLGIAGAWFSRPGIFSERIQVPGTWQGQGYGHEGRDEVAAFRLKARVFRATYKGTGWCARAFQVPDDWNGSRLWLHFGGAHPSAEVWLDGVRLGENDMPYVPFAFEVTDLLDPGETHLLVVRVHERNRQFGLAYNWQGNWSGLYRGVELTATGDSYIARCSVLPEVDEERIGFRLRLGGMQPEEKLRLQVSASPLGRESETVQKEVPVTESEVTFRMPVLSPQLWSPDAPNLYRVEVALVEGENVLDALVERAGFVKLSTQGKRFLINGEPYYMRGTGDFISCPETGCPDTDRARWRRKLHALRDYGYNYVRCQSYVYTPEYFDAADEVGVLIQSEMGMLGPWGGPTEYHRSQWPKPTPDNYPILKRQWDLTVQRDVNHPSANLYCMSNEYGTSCPFPRMAWECYHDTKAMKPTAFVIWTDGGFDSSLPGEFVNWHESRDAEVEKPLVAHEFKWWSSFPDVRTAYRYSGAVRPYGVDIAREAAQRRGLVHLLPACAHSSQRLQLLEAKVKLEMLRRDYPRLAGICHFNAMDTTPSPQGIIDEFYEKKLADAATWLQTNGDTVLLCTLGIDDRVVQGGQHWHCQFYLSDFAHPPFREPVLEWQLVTEERALDSGQWAVEHTPYRTCQVGEIEVNLPEVPSALACRLEAALVAGDRRVANSWKLWLLPAEVTLPAGVVRYGEPQYTWLHSWAELPQLSAEDLGDVEGRVVLSERLDEPLVGYLCQGGRVLLAAGEGLVRPHPPNFGYVKYFFTPPANYPTYEDGQNGTVVAEHPLWGDYPHEGYCDLQFFRVIEEWPPIDLEPLELTEGDPVLRVIHRYPVFHPLGYVVERQVGRGRLVLCALGLERSLPEGRYLLARMCQYLAGPEWVTAVELSQEGIRGIASATALP
jgi:beta-galactosidase